MSDATARDAVKQEPAREPQKVNLLGLSAEKLVAFFAEIGEKPFRATQVLKWIHQLGADDFEQMTNLSKALRGKLQQHAEIRAPEVVSQQDSSDGTRKWLIRVTGGSCVETVFIPDGDRGNPVCVLPSGLFPGLQLLRHRQTGV